MVHSSCTDLTQATALLIIFLVSKIKKSGTVDNNLRNGKRHFGLDRPKWADRWKKTTFEGGSKYSGRPNQTGPFRLISNRISGILDWMESALL